MDLVWPAAAYLDGVRDALRRGWAPDSRRPESTAEELARIEADPARYLEAQVDREATGAPITLPDGSVVPRLPGYQRWIWDGEFCGSINLRWQPGTTDLPDTCPGHIGYTIVPWKRRRGYATRALALMLEEARHEGLPFVMLATAETNRASRRVIEANRGIVVATEDEDRFEAPEVLYRIDLVRACSASA